MYPLHCINYHRKKQKNKKKNSVYLARTRPCAFVACSTKIANFVLQATHRAWQQGYVRHGHLLRIYQSRISYVSESRLASSPARAENGRAPGTHCLPMRLISLRCGDSGLFSDSSVLCDVRVWTRYSILVRILKWRVMKVRIAAQLLIF